MRIDLLSKLFAKVEKLQASGQDNVRISQATRNLKVFKPILNLRGLPADHSDKAIPKLRRGGESPNFSKVGTTLLHDLSSMSNGENSKSNFSSVDNMKANTMVNDWSLAKEEELKVSKRKAKIFVKTKQLGVQVQK